MKNFYSIKNQIENLNIVLESCFVLQFFEATKNMAPMGVLCILVTRT